MSDEQIKKMASNAAQAIYRSVRSQELLSDSAVIKYAERLNASPEDVVEAFSEDLDNLENAARMNSLFPHFTIAAIGLGVATLPIAAHTTKHLISFYQNGSNTADFPAVSATFSVLAGGATLLASGLSLVSSKGVKSVINSQLKKHKQRTADAAATPAPVT